MGSGEKGVGREYFAKPGTNGDAINSTSLKQNFVDRDVDHMCQLFGNSVRRAVKLVPMLGSGSEYTISIPQKAADILIDDIDCHQHQRKFKKQRLLVPALSQLKTNIRERMYPIYIMDDVERMARTNGQFKSHGKSNKA